MKRLAPPALLFLLFSFALAPVEVSANTRGRRSTARAATCTGSTPCRACKNCRYCKHCAKEGGNCGVCKKAESAKRTWDAEPEGDQHVKLTHRH